MTNEILSLQFGHYSNFIGTHWWNIQELGFKYDPDNPSKINHDVLFREGVNLRGEVTFTPRLLLTDLKGSLKTLQEDGDLYKLPEDTPVDNSLQIHSESPEEKNSFLKDLEKGTISSTYDLDNEVKVWSDFLYSRFHPRTVNVIKEYQHSSENLFDIYPLGVNLWKKEQFTEDFSDRIRNYIEECNNLQGFHVLLDSNNGFSGLAVSCLEYLKDEYDSKPILGFPVSMDYPSDNPLQLLTLAFCFDGLTEHSSLFTPLSTIGANFKFVNFKTELPYHTSAILASTLDTLTLNYRLKSSKYTLGDICSDFNTNGRKVAAASVSFPFPLKKNEDLIDCLDNWQGSISQSLTPNCQIDSDYSLQMITLRGIPESRLKQPPHIVSKQRDMPAYRCNNIKEMLTYFLACTCYGSRNEVAVCGEQMMVKTPFPRFFDKITRTGDIDAGSKGDVESVNVLAGLHSGTFVKTMLDGLIVDLEKIKYKKFHQFGVEGVENDEIKECFDRLLDLRDCYEDSYLI